MTEIMTPSEETTTVGQIDKAVANYRAMLEKHSPHFAASVVQQVLGSSELAKEQYELFRKHVEVRSSMIVRHATVNRSRSRQEAISATDRAEYLNDEVVATMLQGTGDSADVHFFKLDRYISDNDLEKEYALRGLKPADPYALAAVNEADQAFADEHPNCTHWKDVDGNWCYAAFGRWGDGRFVRVFRDDFEWSDDWWFAGVGK